MDSTGHVYIVAGTGVSGFFGDGGPATNAELNLPRGIAVDKSGNILFADGYNHRIRKIDGNTGIISTIAGSGSTGPSGGGFSGDGGLATIAMLDNPGGICVDTLGNIFLSDTKNYRIRKIDTTGKISTIAGNGIPSSTGDFGMATNASCYPADGITIDRFCNIYIAQMLPTIRKINVLGIITTIAGDTAANVFNGDGILATSAHLEPDWLAFGNSGNLYISDGATNLRVRVIDQYGIINTITGNGADVNSGDNGPATAASVAGPTGLALDNCGNLFVGDVDGSSIRKVTFNPYCWPSEVPQLADNQLKIYPNPVLETLYIDNVKTITSYSLFNITGIMITKGTLAGGSNVISLAGLAAGVYVVKIWDGDGVETVRRVVKW